MKNNSTKQTVITNRYEVEISFDELYDLLKRKIKKELGLKLKNADIRSTGFENMIEAGDTLVINWTEQEIEDA